MAIFCCDDPDARGKHANAMGVRTANVITTRLDHKEAAKAFVEKRKPAFQGH